MKATTRLAIIVGVLATGMVGWALGGYPGAAGALALGVAAGVIRWRRQPLWSWLMLWRQRRRAITLSEPITVANDRSGGGVRYQDGVAVPTEVRHCSASALGNDPIRTISQVSRCPA